MYASIQCTLMGVLLTLFASLATGCSDERATARLGSLEQALTSESRVLSGLVFGGGSPLAGAQVEALVDGTTAVVASAATDPAGGYALTLEPATYDLRVTPPIGSGYSVQVVQNVVMGSSDRRHDVVLVSDAASGIVGQVRGHGGLGTAGLWVTAVAPDGGGIASVQTDAQGNYELNVSPGPYQLLVQPNGSHSGVPSASFYYYSPQFDVSGATSYEVDLPVAKVEGTLIDESGSPVDAVTVSLSTWANNGSGSYWSANSSTVSSSDGHYELYTFTGNNNFRLSPPAPLVVRVDSNVSIEGDTTRDYTLGAGSSVSGQVRGHGGLGTAGLWVTAVAPDGGGIASVQTDEQGNYALNVSPGPYQLLVQPNGSHGGVPNSSFYYYSPQFDVSGASSYDVDLPVAKIHGTVSDANGAPVPDVRLASSGWSNNGAGSYWSANSSAVSSSDGRYELYVFTGNNNFHITPPAPSGFTTTVLTNLHVSGDFEQTVALQRPDLSPPVIVSGPIVVHLSDTSVSINFDTNEPTLATLKFGLGDPSSSVSGAGPLTHHEFTLVDLEPSSIYAYQVSATDAAGNGPTRSAVLTFRTQDPPGDVTPPVIIAGPEAIGIGIDSATIAWATDEPATSLVHFGTTPSFGSNANRPGFTTDHGVVLSGLSAATRYYFQVESSDPDGNGPTLSATFSFETAAVPDTQAPQIVAGPSIVSATDQTLTVSFTTDEPATSGVSYNDGVTYFVVSDSALVTEHFVVLAALTPSTIYEITVSSSDGAGNGPTLGGPIDGTTLATADTTPPVISNVQVSSITETSALVTWETNEPASGQIRYGIDSGAPSGQQGDTTARRQHSQLLTGLAAGTTYYFMVASSDTAGNESVTPEASFMTSAPPGSNDDDHDGVANGTDRCAGTAPGMPVDANGCSIAQLCPCAGPIGSKRGWKNHGAYVSCVTQAAQTFQQKKLISAVQRKAIVSAAGKSRCGKDKHDCRD